jgi:hypothetical protein
MRRLGIVWLWVVVLAGGCGGRASSAGSAAGAGTIEPAEDATTPEAEAATGAGAGEGASTGAGASTEGLGAQGAEEEEAAYEATRGAALEEVRALRANPPPAIVGNAYVHVHDEDGGAAAEGVTVLLMFEPGGTALLYIASETEGLGHEGEWRWDGTKLTLRFGDEDFRVDATFALDVAADEATMPFHVFSAVASSSRWRRLSLGPLAGAKDVFHAILLAKDAPLAEALRRATDYANAQIVLVPSGTPTAEPTEPVGEPAEEPPPPPPIEAVSADEGGLDVFYDDGPQAKLVLVSWITAPPPPPLVPGPLAGDPRAHLPGEPPHAGPDDPPRKSAVFIAPFFSERNPQPMAKSMDDMAFGERTLNSWEGVIKSGSVGFEFTAVEAKLKEAGYTVDYLPDNEASVAKVITALGGDDGNAPGILVFNTHGMSDGELALGTYLGSSESEAWDHWWPLMKEYGRVYGNLITFDGGTAQAPKTLSWMIHGVDYGSPFGVRYFLSLRPAFWRWLGSRGARFDRSLVYMAACLTDATPYLRLAIAARAYFAFGVPAIVETAGAIFNYLMTTLTRPTWTAEEAYYNILRVAKTGEMIYAEDKLLDGNLPPEAREQRAVLPSIFHGRANAQDSLVPYEGNGWLDTTRVDPGHIFWLLLSARLITSRDEAYQKLGQCWTDVWSLGWAPALADPGCTLMTMGAGPNQDEVAYAQYTLAGRSDVPFSGTSVPRWTMNDGR